MESGSIPVRSFYSLRPALHDIEENIDSSELVGVDIVQIPPNVDELSDEEDLDDDVVDDEEVDPSYYPEEVCGTIEIHSQVANCEVNDESVGFTSQSEDKSPSWRKSNPNFKFPDI